MRNSAAGLHRAGARGVQTAHRGKQPGPGVPPDEVLIRIARAVYADGPRAVTLQVSGHAVALVGRQQAWFMPVSKRWSNSSASVKLGTDAAVEQGQAPNDRQGAHLQEVATLDHEVLNHAVKYRVLVPLRLPVAGTVSYSKEKCHGGREAAARSDNATPKHEGQGNLESCPGALLASRLPQESELCGTRAFSQRNQPVLAGAELPEIF